MAEPRDARACFHHFPWISLCFWHNTAGLLVAGPK